MSGRYRLRYDEDIVDVSIRRTQLQGDTIHKENEIFTASDDTSL